MIPPHLTPRELQVLLVLCHHACWLEKEMPGLLGLSLSSIKRHKEKLFEKFKVNGRLELQVKAMQWGLVPCHCSSKEEEAPGTGPIGP